MKREIVTLNSKIETQDREIEDLATENEEQGEKIDSLSSQIDELKEDMEGRMDNVRITMQDQADSIRCHTIDLNVNSMYVYVQSEVPDGLWINGFPIHIIHNLWIVDWI